MTKSFIFTEILFYWLENTKTSYSLLLKISLVFLPPDFTHKKCKLENENDP